MKNIQIHPLAEIFPAMVPEDFKGLVASIAEHGQLHEITLYQGKILDGRHRYQACKDAGVKPKFDYYKGSDPLSFVVTANLSRRHLDASQRAMLAARIADLKRGQAGLEVMNEADEHQSANLRLGSTTHAQAAAQVGVSERLVDAASKILDEAPKKLIAKVDAGEISLHAAEKIIKEKSAKKEKVLDETKFPVPPELVELWMRKNEIMEMLRDIASIRNKLLERQKEKDVLFSTLDFGCVAFSLDKAHQEIRNVQLWAVCTSCQGRDPNRCKFCKGRGILSKFAWDSFVPSEIKAVRSKACE